ncbi:MAG: nucleotidyltransferase substrate binding protein [Clostridiales bacterium]|nr:nucleotidyltransferase substrate binding protein [Clostridiales bacterium]
MSKLKIKLDNFRNALLRLKEAELEFKKSDASDVVRDGLIQRFEFTYELAWKTTKDYLEDLGIVDRNSPKLVIKEAFAQKIIKNEKNWLLMLNDRNMTSHIYKEEMAREIAQRIIELYIGELGELLNELQ